MAGASGPFDQILDSISKFQEQELEQLSKGEKEKKVSKPKVRRR